MKIFFQTLGCRLNQAEMERMAQAFVLAGHDVVSSADDAEVKVVNTCSVTGEAGRKSRRAARPVRTGQKVVVTGCHSDVRPGEFKEADLVVSNADKDRLVALTLERFGMDGLALGMDFKPAGGLRLFPLVLDHTRAFVKIQDGCNQRCAFCMTTIARGASHSRPANEILSEVAGLAEKGCREIVLTGVHAGSYADGDVDLGRLLSRILDETAIPRVRLSSLEPWNFKYDWIRLWTDYPGRMCRHLHMSLQSGSDAVLRRMRRVYTSASYAEKATFLKNHIPGLAITTDIIVGFPGETEDEHQESLHFIEQQSFAGAHVFTFSSRPGTEAAEMPGHVSREAMKARYEDVKKISDKAADRFRKEFIGSVLPVLWEDSDASSRISGLSDNYLRVYADGLDPEANSIEPVEILSAREGGLVGVSLRLSELSSGF